jgi:GntR family transcriptional regulator
MDRMRATGPEAAPDLRLPRYLQIRDDLMRRICARAWSDGQPLPAEDRLAGEFEVSVGTVRKALQVLVAEGMLERVHGKGTFVTRAFERISMMRFVRFTEEERRELPTTRCLNLEVGDGPPEARARLGLAAREKLLSIHRTRACGKEVILSEHVWLSHRRFAPLEAYLKKESPPLLYPVYDSLCGVLVSRAMDELSMVPLPARDARVFGLAAGTPAIRIERLMTDPSEQPIEWRVSYVTQARFHYAIESR